jgi:uncharacterized protein YndB with AHSA1/START domain
VTVDVAKFKPNTVYVTYIAATPEQVWQALTDPAFTRQYFFGFAIEIEPRAGGAFKLLAADGSAHVNGEVLDWSPPRRLSCSWGVKGMQDFGELPDSVVTYEIETSGETMKLTLMESHSWDVPPAILAGGRAGWPKIISALKSVIETGKPLRMGMEGPPPGMIEAVQRAIAEKPWERR